jgi:hypothetical protein
LFYDTYALLRLNEALHVKDKFWHDVKTAARESWARRGDEPYEVASCFSGFAIYRISTLLPDSVRYTNPSLALECEHVTLNEKIASKKVVDPSMINFILLND